MAIKSLEALERKRAHNRVYMRSYFKRNKDKILAANKEYRKKHPDRMRAYQAVYVAKYPERVRKSKIRWVKNHPESLGRWAKQNPERANKIKYNYKARHPETNLQNALRNRILLALKSQGIRKNKRTIEMIGCSIEELRKHLELKFLKGMTWENRGYWGWHIDHIKPISLFDLNDIEQQKTAFHYTNLQPLWMKDNFSKKNKYA